MKYFILITSICILAACNQSQRALVDAKADKFKRNVNAVGTMIQDAFTYAEPAPAQPGIPQTRYCYKSFYDIVCYDTPQDEDKVGILTGYQGPAPLPREFDHNYSDHEVMAAPTSGISVTDVSGDDSVDAPFEVRDDAIHVPAKAMMDDVPSTNGEASSEPTSIMPRI